jgi:hypothetical protein
MLNLKTIFSAAAFLTLSACATTHIAEEVAPLPVIPEYVKVPHPAGFDLADLRAIFLNPMAPKAALGEFADTCDEEFVKLSGLTPLKEERKAGAVELVIHDPERMHWCFYSKISRLQDVLQSDATWTSRQKKVLEIFDFLTPVANAFMDQYHDSRYLRWASNYYARISEWVFFRKVGPTPENTLLLTSGTRLELEPWVEVRKNGGAEISIFAKYGISMIPSVAGAKNPLEEATRVPASTPPSSEPSKELDQ